MKPILLFAFANDPSRPLDKLDAERAAIREKLAYAQKEALCEVHIIERADIDSILDVFRSYPDRIAVFHFAGHAGSYELCLQGADGKSEIANAGGFAEFLALQRGLQLVFLNGCSTLAQVEELLKARVGAVIATSQAINDTIAASFSAQFYHSLGAGTSIQQAFQEAAAAVKMKMGPLANHRGALYENPSEQIEHFPWGLYVSEGAGVIRSWNLPDAAGNPLFGLPKPPRRELPDQPFRFLRWFRPEDAEIFFGRAYQIRDLYDKITSPATAGIVHLYGRSGVGKSSLLAAGLFPRLQADHEVKYIRRSQEKGLLPSLAATFAGPANPELITTAWLNLEKETGKPLTIILDQVEEVFTRPLSGTPAAREKENSPQELDALLEVARHLTTPGRQPKGKLILSYRKEYLAEIENRFVQAKIAYDKMFLQNLQRDDIAAAVTGLTRSPETLQKYGLKVEEDLPGIIADDLLEDPDSPIAPVLQILLSKMWEQTPVIGGQRTFTTATYQKLKKEGLLLGDFLQQKLDELKAWNSRAVESGLVLGLLLFHTTSKGTAARRSLAEIEGRYPQHRQLLPTLLTELKNRYLLVEVPTEEGQGFDLSLAHDTLAPLLMEMAQFSDFPAQKAYRILTNKVADWTPGDIANALDTADLKAVEEGRWGMRTWTDAEKKLVDASRERRARARRTRRRVIGGGVVMLLLIITASVVAWVQRGQAQASAQRAREQEAIARRQAQAATSNSLTANAILERTANPTRSFRLAEYALRYDSTNTDALGALLGAFYAQTFELEGRLFAGPFYQVVTTWPEEDPAPAIDPAWRAEVEAYFVEQGSGEYWNTPLDYAFSNDQAKALLSVPGPDGILDIRIWDLLDRQRITIIPELGQEQRQFITSRNFSGDSRLVVVPVENRGETYSLEKKYGAYREEPLFTLRASNLEMRRAAFTGPVQVTTEYKDNIILQWDLTAFPIPFSLMPNSEEAFLFFEPEGKQIVTIDNNKNALVWDESGNPVTLPGPTTLAADGRSLVSGGTTVLDLEGFEHPSLRRFLENLEFRDTTADGQLYIEGSSQGVNAVIKNKASGAIVRQLTGHITRITSVDAAADGRYWLTASMFDVRLWDREGNNLFTLSQAGGIAGFLPGEKAFYVISLDPLSGFPDGPASIWWIDAADLIDRITNNGIHLLSPEEKQQFGIEEDLLPGN